ncbi:MAG: NAD+ synthase [Bacteroidetes bacterium]|nr:MAG: NAD+ synthase [Bacteroidota bacterium]
MALAQLNYIIGDFDGNLSKITAAVADASSSGAELVIFSELSICGYPPLDLLERKEFIHTCGQSIEKLATLVDPATGVLVGGPEFNPNKDGKLLFNSAFFLHEGKVKQVFRKSLLPTYDIFDEYRYFEPNREFHILEFKNRKLAVTICEDLWDEQPFDNEFSRSRLYTSNPLEELSVFEPDVIINIAASPFSHRKMEVKQSIFTGKAKRYKLPVLYCNQVGAHTELIFEGGSLAIHSSGRVAAKLPYFREDILICDLDELTESEPHPSPGVIPGRIGTMADALICGIKDYFGKLGFRTATLGLSGGIDSAVTLALAAEALGPANLHVLLLPSQYSSDHSVNDSVQMAENLGIKYDILPIEALFNEFRETLQALFKDMPEDIAEENIQARIRGTLLMALSNKFGNILLNTSNKSETAVGYGTLYGDMSGGLSVLGDVYKTDVYLLALYLNQEQEVIPANIISKPPSAELKPDQKDSDSLPPYDVLDQILEAYIERQLPVEKLEALGFDPKLVSRVIKLVNMNEYKRYQTPPILRVSSKAFGIGRRLPLVARY